MRVNGTGVGIGTTSVVEPFQVHLSAGHNVGIFVSTLPSAIGAFNDAFNAWDNLQVGLNLFSMASGNVGIGTTGPDSNLEISSTGATNVSINGASANATLKFENAGTLEWQMFNDTGNANSIRITNGTSGVKLNQGDTLWSSVSDARLKTDVQSLSVLDRLGHFRAVTFRWKGKAMPAATQLGVIAQEVYPLFPEVVTKGSDDPNEAVTPLSPGAWTVKYELLGALALEGVKELAAKNDQLTAKNDELAAEHITDVKAIEELSREVAELRREIHPH